MIRWRNMAGWFSLLIWGVVILVSLLQLRHAPALQTDLTQFLPETAEQQNIQLIRALEHGSGSRLVIVQLQGNERTEVQQSSQALKQKLAGSAYFNQVLNGQQLLTQEDVDRLLAYRYLLSDVSDFSSDSLRSHLQERLQELASPLGLMGGRKLLRSDPVGAASDILKRLRGSDLSQADDGSLWYSEQYQSALLMLYTRAATHQLNELQQAVDLVHRSFDEINTRQRVAMALFGAPVIALQSRSIIRSEAQTLSLLGSIGVVALLLVFFRSLPILLLSVLPIASGILTGMAAVTGLFGQMHGITLVFGITLIGISVDYPIHLFSHLKQGRVVQRGRFSKILSLGALTTAGGFSSLLLSDFPALSQLAVFSVVGVFTALLVTLFIVPSIVTALGLTLRKNPGVNIPLPSIFGNRRWMLIPLLSLLLSAIYLGVERDSLLEKDIRQLSPMAMHNRQLENIFRDLLKAPDTGRFLVIRAASLQQLLQNSERSRPLLDELVAQGVLKSYRLPTRYLPSAKTQLERQSRLPDSETLNSRLQQAQQGLAFKAKLFTPFVEAVEKSRHLRPLTMDDLKGTIFSALLQQQIFQLDGQWYATVSLSGIQREQAIMQLAQTSEQLQYLNIAALGSALIHQYTMETARLALIAMLVIFIALWLLTPGVRVFSIMLPVIAAVLTTATLVSLGAVALSLFHVAALLLVLGIGLDYSLFIHNTRRGQADFPATVSSLLVCSLSTILVFSLLSSSDVPVLHAMGMTVTIGTLLAWLFSFLMLRED